MPTQPFIVIPLDARPVCYQWVRQLGAIGQWPIKLPPPIVLGQLKQPADHTGLMLWFQRALMANPKAPVILALDTCIYGGLIPSRLHQESLETLQHRLTSFLALSALDKRPVYAFSSIMRIPAYNNDEEEPAYWAQYGQQLYELSAKSHETNTSLAELTTMIPPDVIQDMITRRATNTALNQALLDHVLQGTITQLRFGQDDTGAFGLNVQEAQALQALIDQSQLGDRVGIQTGCDELAGVMLAKAIQDTSGEPPVSVHVCYNPKTSADVMARFDGIPIDHVVQRQQQTLGLITAPATEADIQLAVLGPQQRMGDWCEAEMPDITEGDLTAFQQAIAPTFSTIAIADVACANGGHPELFKRLLSLVAQKQVPLAYAGWNTPGNTIGSTLALATIVTLAKRANRYQSTPHRVALLMRLLDDAVYQPTLRAQLRQRWPVGVLGPSDDEIGMTQTLNESLSPTIASLTTALGLDPCQVKASFPCHRSFEIQVDVALLPNTKLTGVTNDRIQAAVELQHAKARRTRHQWLIETTHPIAEAWENGVVFESIYQDEAKPTPLWNSPTRPVAATDNVMKKLSTTQTPPELVGVTEPLTPLVKDAQALRYWLSVLTTPTLLKAPRIVLGCWGLQDPGNLGTLIRSACAFSVAGVVMIEPDVTLDNPKVIRATAGQGFRLPMMTLDDSAQLWAALADMPEVTVWATDVTAGQSFQSQDWSDGYHLILLGNEAHGLPPLPEAVKARVKGLHIPMAAGVESINVAMAGTILLSHSFASTNSP